MRRDTYRIGGMGWLPDYPDNRDYTIESEAVQPLFAQVGADAPAKTGPKKVDLRQWCSPIEDQGALGSCTANAGVGLLEYFERRAFGKHIDGSRLFLYKNTRRLLHWKGDTGAFLRTTMGAMVIFGVVPEEHWPYRVDRFDQDPPAFAYAFAQNYETVQYARLDPANLDKDDVLNAVKTNLAAGIPSMFGFPVFDSIAQADDDGKIPFPSEGDAQAGGHAIVAVGYDDGLEIKNESQGPKTKGALLIRNSWGKSWGDKGYGWLPYQYVLDGLAVDWWTLIQAGWIDTGQFGKKA